METYDVIILGGGLSGISCCSLLQSRGLDCLLLEKEKTLGGLTRTCTVDGFVFDVHGGHIFNTRNERVRDWVFSVLPKSKWHYSRRISKIFYRGKIISYPFELAIGELEPHEAVECLMGIIQKKGRQPDNFGDWLRWSFGDPIAEKYLIPYNRKIWKRDLRKMSTHWVRGKMPMPDLREIILSALKRDATEKKMVHSTYYYPKQGGIWGFVGRFVGDLKSVKMSSPLRRFEKDRGFFVVNGRYRSRKIISTIPIPELAKAIDNIPNKVRECISKLQSNSITTVLCEQKKGRRYSWMYLPGREFLAHRIVYQGGLAGSNCPNGKYSATYEITGRHKSEKVLAGLRRRDLSEELRAVRMIDHSYTKYAYPIYHLDFVKDMKIVNKYLGGLGVISSGRFAEWKYLNMDDCMARALEVADEICSRDGLP